MGEINQVCRFDHTIVSIVDVHVLTVWPCLCKSMSLLLGRTLIRVGVKGTIPALDWKGHKGPVGVMECSVPLLGCGSQGCLHLLKGTELYTELLCIFPCARYASLKN